MDLLSQFASAHPLYSHALTLFVGCFLGPQLVKFAEGKIPAATDWLNARQKAGLKRLGLSDVQIRAVERHEVADMRAGADELERQLNAEEAAAAHLAGDAPAPSAASTSGTAAS